MTTTADPYPDIPLPAGAHVLFGWEYGKRDLFGVDRNVTDHEVRVYALGSQSTDGAISGLVVVA
jgi:hypothetical protein